MGCGASSSQTSSPTDINFTDFDETLITLTVYELQRARPIAKLIPEKYIKTYDVILRTRPIKLNFDCTVQKDKYVIVRIHKKYTADLYYEPTNNFTIGMIFDIDEGNFLDAKIKIKKQVYTDLLIIKKESDNTEEISIIESRDTPRRLC